MEAIDESISVRFFSTFDQYIPDFDTTLVSGSIFENFAKFSIAQYPLCFVRDNVSQRSREIQVFLSDRGRSEGHLHSTKRIVSSYPYDKHRRCQRLSAFRLRRVPIRIAGNWVYVLAYARLYFDLAQPSEN